MSKCGGEIICLSDKNRIGAGQLCLKSDPTQCYFKGKSMNLISKIQ